MILGVLEGGAGGGKAGGIGGEHITSARQILLLRLGVGGDRDRFISDVVDAEEVGQVQLGGGAGLDANRCAVEFLGRGHTQRFGRKEALAIVVVHTRPVEFQVGITAVGVSGVADQHIHFARGQCGKAGLACGREKVNCIRITKNRGSHGPAQANVEPFPDAIGIGRTKTDKTGVRAAVQRTARFDIVQRGRLCSPGNQTSDGQCAEEYGFFHIYLFLSSRPRLSESIILVRQRNGG